MRKKQARIPALLKTPTSGRSIRGLRPHKAVGQPAAPQTTYRRANLRLGRLTAADFLALQRIVGNRQVQRMRLRQDSRAHGEGPVIQAASRFLGRQTWGTAKTTAPPANNKSPGDVFRGQLRDEVALFANAGVIVDWIVAERAAAGGATVTSFTTARLFADSATMKKLKPAPTSPADLVPALQMLEYYNVVKRMGRTTGTSCWRRCNRARRNRM